MIGKMPQTRWRCDRRCALRLGAEKRLTRRCMGGGDRCGERNPFGRDGKAANRRKAAALETRRARFGREEALRLHIFFQMDCEKPGERLGAAKKNGAEANQSRLRLSKNPRRAREGRSSLELLIVPGGVYGGRGTIFAEENLIFQSKNRFLAVFAPGNLKDFSKNW